MLIQFLLIFLLLCFSTGLQASLKAKVIFVKGHVTKLLPKTVEASAVVKGEFLPEDTSLVTSKSSVVRIQFADKSTINLGPESKIVVSKMPEKKANMINILSGVINSEVKKQAQENENNKMILKTRTAVMGVRGTKFQTIYNPQNNTTSLVTIEGKVAIIKPVDRSIKQNVARVEKGKATSSPEVVERALTPEQELEKFDSDLKDSPKQAEVSAGKFSGVSSASAEPTRPVKISPKQFDVIAKTMHSEKTAEEVMKVDDPEADLDLKDTSGPRPGGMVDFQTGLYIPPAVSDKLDKKTGTYTLNEKLGSIDEQTGDYIPPKGIELDAKKGFILSEEKAEVASAGSDTQMQEVLQSLNRGVTTQLHSEQHIETKNKWYRPQNHSLSLEILPISESMTVKDKATGKSSDFLSEGANSVILQWGQKWNENWSTRFELGQYKYGIEKTSLNVQTYENTSEYISLGTTYSMNENYFFDIDIENTPVFLVFPSTFNSSTVVMTKSTFMALKLGVKKKMASKWSLNWFSYLTHKNYFSSNVHFENNTSAMNGYSTELGVTGVYSLKNNLNLTGLFFLNRSVLSSNSFDYQILSLGTGLNLFWSI